jgi:hypothetical protein
MGCLVADEDVIVHDTIDGASFCSVRVQRNSLWPGVPTGWEKNVEHLVRNNAEARASSLRSLLLLWAGVPDKYEAICRLATKFGVQSLPRAETALSMWLCRKG